MSTRMLVTPDGRWVFPGSPEFFSALGDLDPDYNAEAFAIKNLGFIGFTIHAGLIDIKLHPRVVTDAAMRSVERQVRASSARKFSISFCDESLRIEWIASAEAALARLAQLCAPEPVTSHERFAAEKQDFSLLAEKNKLLKLLQVWNDRRHQFDEGIISFAVQHQLLERLVIISARQQPSDLVFRFVGEGHHSWLGREHLAGVIGESCRNLPDREYGTWVTQFPEHVIRSGEPHFDHVTAIIRKGSAAYRVHYERLMLPWEAQGRSLVTALTYRLEPNRKTPVSAGTASVEPSVLSSKATKQ